MNQDALQAVADPEVVRLADSSLLIVDDDSPLRMRLARAMEARGFTVRTAESIADGVQSIRSAAPAFGVFDLKLGDGSGLELVEALHRARPDARVVMLTGYGN
ncbi:MAG: response regulator, partial [Alphaproteobacteria bacterium]